MWTGFLLFLLWFRSLLSLAVFFFYIRKEDKKSFRSKPQVIRERERDGEEIGWGLRLPVQGSINRWFGRREIEYPLPFHQERVLPRIQIHHRCRIRHSNTSGLSLSLYISLSVFSPSFFCRLFRRSLIFDICWSRVDGVSSFWDSEVGFYPFPLLCNSSYSSRYLEVGFVWIFGFPPKMRVFRESNAISELGYHYIVFSRTGSLDFHYERFCYWVLFIFLSSSLEHIYLLFGFCGISVGGFFPLHDFEGNSILFFRVTSFIHFSWIFRLFECIQKVGKFESVYTKSG